MIEAPEQLLALDVNEFSARLTWEWVPPPFFLTLNFQPIITSEGDVVLVSTQSEE